jgi:phosphatidylinositol alpha-1,6-mannosyltransferase
MARWTDLPPHTVEPAGVDVEAFRRHGRAGLPPWARGGPLVLSVGAIKPRKGHAIALQAVRLVQSEFPDLHHVIVGGGAPGGEAGRLQARAQALGLGERFHLLEDQVHEELLAWYHRADVFLLLPVNVGGSFEGLGLAYLEAAAAGTPCIATRACGAAEAVADGETGLLVPQHDAQAAADALARLLRSKTLRARLGQAGRRRAGQFTWAHLAERLETEYARLAAGRRRGAA